jgi:hypothetical protein
LASRELDQMLTIMKRNASFLSFPCPMFVPSLSW